MIMKKTSKPKTGRKPAKALPKGQTAAPTTDARSVLPRKHFLSFIRHLPSVEDVATLAARLMKGDDVARAVDSAIDLMGYAAERCSDLNTEIQEENRDKEEDYPNFLFHTKSHYTFRQGAKEITGQKRADRAVERLQDLLASMVAEMPEMTTEAKKKKKLFDWLTKLEKEGFTPEQVEKAHGRYFNFRKKR